MAFPPDSSPGHPGVSGMPVKRAEEDRDSVPADWLLESEHLSQAENIDRLSADFDLVTTLALSGYDGPDWRYFSTELAKYGMAVIGGWMRRGIIAERCRDRGFGGLPELGRKFHDDEIEELTGETIAKALVHFRVDVLMTNRWDHRKGATLRTFFVGQCLIRYANVYRRWWSNENRNRYRLTGDNETLDALAPRVVGSDSRAVDRTTAERTMSSIKDTRVRKAMLLTAAGRSQAEIAIELEVTEKGVERMLANERSRLRRRATG
jgi:hypothetical protein